MGYFPSFLSCFLAVHFLLNSLHKSGAFQSDSSAEGSNHFHTVEVSSLLPASACSHFAKVSREEDSVKLVHNHGPCSPRKHGKARAPSTRELLERDQRRVRFMASRKVYGQNNVKVMWDDINTGEYVVNVSLGTPQRELTLLMDTGSSLLWTQCRPCKLGTFPGCYKQRHTIFDPSNSSTYSNITCPSHTCSMANTTTSLGFTTCNPSSTCVYITSYIDGSIAAGFLGRERLRVGSNIFNDIIFGCNEGNINNSLPGIDGIIGLGQDFLSFVEQTAEAYNKVFSYCLPSKSSEVGFLKFGKAKQVSNKPFKFTQLGAGYAIELVGIKVGNITVDIAIKKGAAHIDSGTVISRLPSKVYNSLREAYRKAMSGYQLAGAVDDVFDTCYHIGGHKEVQFPKMSFLFADGLVLDIPRIGVAFPLNSTLVCLPFATPPGGEDIILFGNIQQKTLEILYDVEGGKLGFAYGGCK